MTITQTILLSIWVLLGIGYITCVIFELFRIRKEDDNSARIDNLQLEYLENSYKLMTWKNCLELDKMLYDARIDYMRDASIENADNLDFLYETKHVFNADYRKAYNKDYEWTYLDRLNK